MYRDGRPHAVARWLNRLSAAQFRHGVLAPRYCVTLTVPGRRTGRDIAVPLVVSDHGGERYLVAMLGPATGWVRNVEANGGRAVLHRRGAEPVRLVEVPVDDRPPILRRYLDRAPGARAHVPVDRHAPPAAFARVAGDLPVFRIEPAGPGGAAA
jgi:hypothetical protein